MGSASRALRGKDPFEGRVVGRVWLVRSGPVDDEVGDADRVLNGDIDGFIRAYLTSDREAHLAQGLKG